MSANADVLRSDDFAGSAAQESPLLQVEVFRGAGRADVWNPEDFAREQIRGLVQRVFFASVGRPVTQVVFSGAEPHMDVSGLCDQVGQALALETSAHIAVVGREMTAELPSWCGGRAAIKSWSRQTAVNLWRVPRVWAAGMQRGIGDGTLLDFAPGGAAKRVRVCGDRGACSGDFERGRIAGTAHGWNHPGAGGPQHTESDCAQDQGNAGSSAIANPGNGVARETVSGSGANLSPVVETRQREGCSDE